MEVFSPKFGRYAVKPVTKGGVITMVSQGVGAMYPSMGKAFIKNRVKVFGMANVSPGWATFGVAATGAYFAEMLVPTNTGDRVLTWKQYLEAEAKADLAMIAADSGLLLALQLGNINNLNPWNIAMSVPIGGALGDVAYKKIVKPLIVKKGRDDAVPRKIGEAIQVAQMATKANEWLNAMIRSGTEGEELTELETMVMDDAGWAS